MSRLISMPFLTRRTAPAAAATVAPATDAPQRPRVGLWVLSAFVAIGAMVMISALVIGPQDADLIVLVPVVLFWTVVVCAGLAVRAALINVTRKMASRDVDKPDAADERLARMVRAERKREARNLPGTGVLHAV